MLEQWYTETKLEVDLNEYTQPAPSYWKQVAYKYPLLSTLAIKVLSIAVNTATCERLFSALGAIQSPARNRLQAEKPYIVQKRVRDADEVTRAGKKTKRIVNPKDCTFGGEQSVAAYASGVSQQPVGASGQADSRQPVGSEAFDENDEMDDCAVEASVGDSFLLWQSMLEETFKDEYLPCDFSRDQETAKYSSYEPIPLPVDMALDDLQFEHENPVTDFRAWSMPLAVLFPLSTRTEHERITLERQAQAERFLKTHESVLP